MCIRDRVLTALSQNIQLATAIQPACEQKSDKIRKLVDIQANVAAGKGIGYERCLLYTSRDFHFQISE